MNKKTKSTRNKENKQRTSLWKDLLLLCKILFLEHRVPWRFRKFMLDKCYALTGKYILFCGFGKRKILKFKVKDDDFSKEIFNEIFYKKVYFPKINNQDFIIKRNNTIIDIGANTGMFSVYAANLSKNGKVYCIEPVKKNFERLEYHKKINKMDNMILINKGISNKQEKARIYLCKDNCGEHSLYGRKEDYNLIECISLKQVFDRYRIKKCDFLKIDCEGAEYKILSSLPKNYFKKIKKIALEYHPNINVLKLTKLLSNKGYKINMNGYPAKCGMVFASISKIADRKQILEKIA